MIRPTNSDCCMQSGVGSSDVRDSDYSVLVVLGQNHSNVIRRWVWRNGKRYIPARVSSFGLIQSAVKTNVGSIYHYERVLDRLAWLVEDMDGEIALTNHCTR
jgi:hypothetical protein